MLLTSELKLQVIPYFSLLSLRVVKDFRKDFFSTSSSSSSFVPYLTGTVCSFHLRILLQSSNKWVTILGTSLKWNFFSLAHTHTHECRHRLTKYFKDTWFFCLKKIFFLSARNCTRIRKQEKTSCEYIDCTGLYVCIVCFCYLSQDIWEICLGVVFVVAAASVRNKKAVCLVHGNETKRKRHFCLLTGI